MGAFDVITVGTDSSGRAVKMTRRMKAAYDEVCRKAGVTPTIVQGAFMGSGGASASAGTHSQSGCLDTRTWNLTTAQRDAVIRAGRSIGWAIWYRTAAQGFDPHCHWVLPGEQPMHPDAQAQVDQYRRGYNGLASWGRDDFWRPSPLPTYKYDSTPPSPPEDDMSAEDVRDIKQTIKAEAERTRKGLSAFRQASLARDKEEAEFLEKLNDKLTSSKQADRHQSTQIKEVLRQRADRLREQVRRDAEAAE